MGEEKSRVIQKKIDDLVVQLAVACEMMDCADCDMVGGIDGPGCLAGNPKWMARARGWLMQENEVFKAAADGTRRAISGDTDFFLLPFPEQVNETHELRISHDELLEELEAKKEEGAAVSKQDDKKAITEYWGEVIDEHENAGEPGDAAHARRCLEIDLRNIEEGKPLLNPQALNG